MGGIAACGVALLAFFGFSGGWTALVIGVAAAVFPVPVLVACFLWLDRYEPEPVTLPGLRLRLGRLRGDRPSRCGQHRGGGLVDRLGAVGLVVAVLVAPVIEES